MPIRSIRAATPARADAFLAGARAPVCYPATWLGGRSYSHGDGAVTESVRRGGRLAGGWRAHGAAARGRAGRAVRATARLRSAAASGRRVRPDAAPGCHGPTLPLARGRGRCGERGRVRRAGDRYVPAQSRPRGVRQRGADPPPHRSPGLPGRLPDHRGDARRRRDRLPDPAAAVHQRRGARDQLDHAAAGRLHRRRQRRARSDPPAARARRRGLWRCAASRPRCSAPTSAATPASASCAVRSGAATSSASTP